MTDEPEQTRGPADGAPEPQKPSPDEHAAPQAPGEPLQGALPHEGAEPSTEPAEAGPRDAAPAAPEEAALAGVPAPGTTGAEEKAEEAPAPPPGTFLHPDGLESGLAWFGEPAFVPPLPPGVRPPERPAEETAETVAVVARPTVSLAERRRLMKERLDARRAVKMAQRKLHHRIPIPLLFCLPIIIATVVYVVFYAKPWDRIPRPTEPIGAELLDAAAVEDQDAKLDELHVEVKPAEAWRLLPTGELIMTEPLRAASAVIEQEKELTDCEVTCEVCLVGRGSYGVWLGLDDEMRTALGLGALPGHHRILKHGFPKYQSETPFRTDELKADYWYELKIRVTGKETQYFLNGYRLPPVPTRPASVRQIVVAAEEARIAIRNWKATPLQD